MDTAVDSVVILPAVSASPCLEKMADSLSSQCKNEKQFGVILYILTINAGCSSCIFWEDFVLSPSMLTHTSSTEVKETLVRPLYNELLQDYEIPSRGLSIRKLRFHSAITTLKKPSFSEGVFEDFTSLEFAE